MDNACDNEDVDERVGAEEWMDDEDDLEDERDEVDRETDPLNYDGSYHPEDDEVPGVEPPLIRRRYGFDAVVGVCSRPIRNRMQLLPAGGISVTVAVWGHWRKHLYKKLVDGRMVCRRCGEAYDQIPF